ncbi:hypothetical protein HG535_0C04530 [Zygotorulaspora mrakii]|uniref:Autophagy-related protein 18 n=1 Tax=Zygotorulaspora mrakii TaxID=42260 RepID=A0A7H9B286_ZYGMR|nr:uncharacterized protein HG535_0C04530 [Zygotorulaspora mrakii]QLG72099.1 hypothetical protein HG535_0C04530 [Zygotorulaspora mrakii]
MPESLPVVNFINFNQTGTCISLGTSQGFKIFNCDPFGKFYSEDSGGYAIVEMLFSTSLLAVVGIGDQPAMSPRRLRIINTKKHSVICEVTFPTSILSVKMNKSRLVVLLQEQIYVYDISNMRLLHTIETNCNPQGIMAVSPSVENCYLVYPSPPKIINSDIKNHVTTNNINVTTGGNPKDANTVENAAKALQVGFTDAQQSSTSMGNTLSTDGNKKDTINSNVMKNGDVILFNMNTLQPTMVIEAHKGEIAALALSFDGLLLATASEKGTIIRVFSVETGVKLHQFRRGTYPTRIHSMCFSSDNQFLALTCSSKTIHIFKLSKETTLLDKHDSDDSNVEEDAVDTASSTRANDLSDDDAPAPEREGDGEMICDEPELASLDDASSSLSMPTETSLERAKEPYVDASRSTVARMIRKSSQKLSRQAAKTLGQIFPIKVSSLIEPSRHFASLKLPIDTSSGIKSITSIGSLIQIDTQEYPELFDGNEGSRSINSGSSSSTMKMLPIRVVTSEGYLYNYVLDPERGGDCLLLSQYSLMLN